jgi:hypothetical protein
MFLYGQLNPKPRVSSIKNTDSEQTEQSLFEYVARENGPLEQFHPQMLLQCLLWGADTCSSSRLFDSTLILHLG